MTEGVVYGQATRLTWKLVCCSVGYRGVKLIEYHLGYVPGILESFPHQDHSIYRPLDASLPLVHGSSERDEIVYLLSVHQGKVW